MNNWAHSTVAGNFLFLTQRFYKRNIDCSSPCLNYLLPEQRDCVCVAQTNMDLLELELYESETPVSRTVYLISVANS